MANFVPVFNYKLLTDQGLITLPTVTGTDAIVPAESIYSSYSIGAKNKFSGSRILDAKASSDSPFIFVINSQANPNAPFNFLTAPNGTEARLATLRGGAYINAKKDNNGRLEFTLYDKLGTVVFHQTAMNGLVSNPTSTTLYGIGVMYNYATETYNLCILGNSANNSVGQYFVQGEGRSNSHIFETWALEAFPPDDPYGLDANNTPEGGYGDFDYSSDHILPPSVPSLSAAQVGFVSLWNPSAQEMKDLASYLWTGTFDLTNFKKLFTDPMECILSVGIVPVSPTTGASTEIIFGGSSHSGVNAKPITTQFVAKDFGQLKIKGQSKSALDYSPYAKASIFLPYCGTYALDVDEIMDATISLEYHIDIYTGACVAYLTIYKTNSDLSILNSTLYQFTGNVLASIPITGADHSQFIQSMLFMGSAIAATVATSGAGAPAIEGAAASGDVAGASALNAVTAGSAVNTVMSMKPNVLHSGNLSSTAGFLGQQAPYITMTWSNLCRPEDEQKLVGMPSQKSGKLSTFSGFTLVSAVHMDNILCTDAERAEIEQLLYKGVIL